MNERGVTGNYRRSFFTQGGDQKRVVSRKVSQTCRLRLFLFGLLCLVRQSSFGLAMFCERREA